MRGTSGVLKLFSKILRRLNSRDLTDFQHSSGLELRPQQLHDSDYVRSKFGEKSAFRGHSSPRPGAKTKDTS